MSEGLTRRHPVGALLRAGLARAGMAVAALAAWEWLAGPLRLGHGLIPPPSAIAGRIAADGFAFYLTAALPTLLGAAIGWLLGNAAGIVLAAVSGAAPRLGRALATLAFTAFCIPGIAIGPIVAVTCSPAVSRVVLAALPIAFLTSDILDNQAATVPAGARDAARAFGGRRLGMLRFLDLPAAVPGLFTALRVSVPFALLGAVSAEFLGAERGLGLVLLAAQHRFMPDRAWAIALVLGGLAVLASAGLAWAGRRAAPWSASVGVDPSRIAGLWPADRHGAASEPAPLLLRTGLVLGAWWVAPRLLGLPSFLAKGPLDVLAYLADPARGVDRCGELAAEMLVTLGDSLSGLVCGVALAAACAAASTVVRPLRSLVMGPALMAQCLPLVAFTPLVVLALGRGPAVAAAIGTLVVFVPVVLRLWAAFAGVPSALADLARVNAASPVRLLVHVLAPAAMPTLLAALRTAVPLACAGALLAEWLATGRGAGYGMLASAAGFDYAAVWARIAATTALTLALSELVRAMEARLLARWTGRPSGQGPFASGEVARAPRGPARPFHDSQRCSPHLDESL